MRLSLAVFPTLYVFLSVATASLSGFQTGMWLLNANLSDSIPLLSLSSVNITAKDQTSLSVQRNYTADDVIVLLSHRCAANDLEKNEKNDLEKNDLEKNANNEKDDLTKNAKNEKNVKDEKNDLEKNETTPIVSRVYPHSVFLGVEYNVSSGVVCTRSSRVDNASVHELIWPLLTSQGAVLLPETHTLSIRSDGRLSYRINASEANVDLHFVFDRSQPGIDRGTRSELQTESSIDDAAAAPSRITQASRPELKLTIATRNLEARTPPDHHSTLHRSSLNHTLPAGNAMFNWAVHDAWELTDPLLQENVMAIALQGLLNRNGSLVYLTYPQDWAYSYTGKVRDYVTAQYNRTLVNATLHDLLLLPATKAAISSYVVWDPSVRESLVVAMTAAGLADALPVTPAQVPMAQELGLKEAYNFDKRFRNMTATAIYTYARDTFFSQCNASHVVWMGGECGTQIRPGIADFGIARRAFFTDLNTDPTTSLRDEYTLANSIVAEAAKQSEGNFYLMG
jgi:predicted nucleic acid-binding protein